MTYPTIDSVHTLSISLSENSNILMIIVVSVIIFITVSIISGIIAYKLKLRKIRKNNENKNIQR